MRQTFAKPFQGRRYIEFGAAITGKAPDFPGAGYLRGNATCDIVADAVDNGAVVDAPADPANGLGDEVYAIALLAHFEPLDQGDVDAARNGVTELPQGLSFRAKAAVVFHVHSCAACPTLK